MSFFHWQNKPVHRLLESSKRFTLRQGGRLSATDGFCGSTEVALRADTLTEERLFCMWTILALLLKGPFLLFDDYLSLRIHTSVFFELFHSLWLKLNMFDLFRVSRLAKRTHFNICIIQKRLNWRFARFHTLTSLLLFDTVTFMNLLYNQLSRRKETDFFVQ